MSADPASLSRLHDIVVPPPLPWWPPAPGWLWVFGIAGIFVVAMLLRAFARWQRNRYRREALAELGRLVAGEADATRALIGLSELLKRTAITAYGRERVASLTGEAWFAFLDRHGGTRFASGPGQAMDRGLYLANVDGTVADIGEITDQVRHWIRRHVPSVASPDVAATDDSIDRRAA